MTCSCSHRAIVHRYVTATRSNQGECLALGCGCRGFDERAENPLGMGGLSVGACENRGGETDGPDGALTPLPGPDLRVNSTTRGAKADA